MYVVNIILVRSERTRVVGKAYLLNK